MVRAASLRQAGTGWRATLQEQQTNGTEALPELCLELILTMEFLLHASS